MAKSIPSDARHPETISIDPVEVAKFEAIAAEWWDPNGKFKPLHKFNPSRLQFIRQTLCAHFGRPPLDQKPLTGLRLLDAGCGGGLVSEPMARLGASVTGLDASSGNIKTASVHALQSGLDIDYRCGTVEGLLAHGEPLFDVVLTLEVVEHVADRDAFLASCAKLVRPGGILIMGTLNRTPKAYLLAIVGAEHILRWLPVGTHDFDKLVKPGEAIQALEAAGLVTENPVGVVYNPILGTFSVSLQDVSVSYLLVGRRPLAS